MVQYYDTFTDLHQEWAMQQSVFFTASAPLTGKHVNISPKGLPSSSFAVFSPSQAAYVDATGSGNETISHIRENGRVTIMFCSFGPSPRILRLFCTGRVVEWDQPEFESLLQKMGKAKFDGARAVIILDIFKTQTSCGFGVPLLAMEPDPADPSKQRPYLKDRDTMGHWAGRKVETNTLTKWWIDYNSDSIDGLPGMRVSRRLRGDSLLLGDMKFWFSKHRCQTEMIVSALLASLFTVLALQFAGLTTFTIS